MPAGWNASSACCNVKGYCWYERQDQVLRTRDVAQLLLLAALWGASFLFMRLGAAEFGSFALAGLRVAGASLVLLPVLALRAQLPLLKRHARPILLLGVASSALPFLCYGYALQHIDAGISSVFNAATPLFGAAIGWLWLGDRLSRARVVGLALGMAGVVGLALYRATWRSDGQGLSTSLAIGACILATLCYGFSANYAKRYLTGVPPMAVAAGTQLAAAIALAPTVFWAWPATTPGPTAWWSMLMLALACTGLAYILYFRLIASIGPSRTTTVTFLIPAFAVAWSAIFLGETITLPVAIGCAVILAGTALATGLWPRPPGAR